MRTAGSSGVYIILLVKTTGDDTAYAQVEKYLPGIKEDLFETTQEATKQEIKLIRKKEGFKDASQVQYVCRAGNFMKDGYTFHGWMNILKVALSHDYFWINIRVKGGAYGCRGVFNLNGDTYFHLTVIQIWKKQMMFSPTADFIRAFDADERDMTKYIIGTISEMDTPLTPAAWNESPGLLYARNKFERNFMKYRDEVLHASVERYSRTCTDVQSVMDQDYFCVVEMRIH